MTRDWRPVLAALANDEVRAVYARVVLGGPPGSGPSAAGTKRAERALDTLRRVGLVTDEDGQLVAPSSVFADVLRAGAPQRSDGVDRFLRDGRIVQYPASPSERAALLRRVANGALQPGERLSEAAVTERLRAFHDDPVTLRRYLVDFRILRRERDGTGYGLVPTDGDDDAEPTARD